VSEHRTLDRDAGSTTVDPGQEQLLGGYSGRLLLTLSAGTLVTQLGRNVLPPLLPAISADVGMSPFLAGIALSALIAMYSLAMYPGGRLADGLTRKTVLVGALVTVVAGLGLTLSATAYLPFLLGVSVFGFGAGLYWISVRGILADLFVAKRGQAFGIQSSLGFLGPVVAAGAAIVVLATTTWRSVFPVLMAVVVLLAVLVHRWIREQYELSAVDLNVVATGARVFGDRHVLWLVLSYSGVVFAMQAAIAFLPTFLQVEKGLSPTVASVGFAVLFAGAIASMPVSGYLGDRFHYVPVAVGGVLLSIVGIAMWVGVQEPVLVGAGIFVFGVGVWSFPPVVQAHLMDRFPKRSMAGDMGAFKTVYAGIGSIGPSYLGFVASVDSYTTGFVGLVPLLLVSVVIVLKTSRSSVDWRN